MRTPDQILADFDDGCKGVADIDMRSVLWEVIEDVQNSYAVALRNHLPAINRMAVKKEVSDYLANNYGDS